MARPHNVAIQVDRRRPGWHHSPRVHVRGAEDLYIVGRGYCLENIPDTRNTIGSTGVGYCVGGYSKVGGVSMEQCADRCRADLRCNGFSVQTDNSRQCLLCPTLNGIRYSPSDPSATRLSWPVGYEWLTFEMGTRLAEVGSQPCHEFGNNYCRGPSAPGWRTRCERREPGFFCSHPGIRA